MVLDILFPPKCAFCGELMETAGDGVCGQCRERLPFRPDGRRLVDAGGFPCAVAFYYEDMVEEGVRALKFGKRSWRAKVFGRYAAQAAAKLEGQYDTAAYVPVNFWRNFSRGFDQGELLARAAAEQLGVPVVPALRKIKHTRPQSSLSDPDARRKNAQNAYTVPHPELVAGKRFLLFDDVVTTGSTIAACGEALMRAGARSVVCAAFAGGHPAGG